uniref:Uncharacterized protein n=1 Tax=Rhizophora mucronata TaxID=61149 RepID=A0A2P2L7G3_RHIMU
MLGFCAHIFHSPSSLWKLLSFMMFPSGNLGSCSSLLDHIVLVELLEFLVSGIEFKS